MEFRKMVTIILYARQKKRHRYIEHFLYYLLSFLGSLPHSPSAVSGDCFQNKPLS